MQASAKKWLVKCFSAALISGGVTGCATVPFSDAQCTDETRFLGGYLMTTKSYNEKCGRDGLIRQMKESQDPGMNAVGQILHENADPEVKNTASQVREMLMNPQGRNRLCTVTGIDTVNGVKTFRMENCQDVPDTAPIPAAASSPVPAPDMGLK